MLACKPRFAGYVVHTRGEGTEKHGHGGWSVTAIAAPAGAGPMAGGNLSILVLAEWIAACSSLLGGITWVLYSAANRSLRCSAWASSLLDPSSRGIHRLLAVAAVCTF